MENNTDLFIETEPSIDRIAQNCSFWLSKRNRYCLTPPLESLRFCEIHARIVDNDPEKYDDSNVKRRDDVEANEESKTCKFWLERKKRFCKVLPKEGLLYCTEHANHMQVGSNRARIPCIYDPRHSCFADQLESHLKKCNSRPSLNPVYFEEGINSGSSLNFSQETSKVALQDVDIEELSKIISKVRSIHEKYMSRIKKDIKTHDVFAASFDDPSNGVSALKHLKQQASLVGHMNSMHFLDGATTYVEFGAGRGGLSHWVQLANTRDDCKFLLVDKSSVRYKKDSYHKGPDQGPSFERLKINIQDLVLEKVCSCYDSGSDIVGIGKHLCGNATDFMLRCIANSEKSLKMRGIVLATCCHHRCEWKSYVGQDWFSKENLDERFFHILTKISAWATCGTRHANEEHMDSESYNHPRYGSLKPEERETIGFLAKNIIDFGRISFLEDHRFQAEIVEYVCKTITLESYAIMAKKIENSMDK